MILNRLDRAGNQFLVPLPRPRSGPSQSDVADDPPTIQTSYLKCIGLTGSLLTGRSRDADLRGLAKPRGPGDGRPYPLR